MLNIRDWFLLCFCWFHLLSDWVKRSVFPVLSVPSLTNTSQLCAVGVESEIWSLSVLCHPSIDHHHLLSSCSHFASFFTFFIWAVMTSRALWCSCQLVVSHNIGTFGLPNGVLNHSCLSIPSRLKSTVLYYYLTASISHGSFSALLSLHIYHWTLL